jgi:hypothetical protein
MVNVRATLDDAVCRGVLGAGAAARIEAAAKHRFYAERDWPAILLDAVDAGVPAYEIGALQSHLAAGGAVDQKRLDALELMERVATDLAGGWAPAPATFEWEGTSAWDLLVRTEAEAPRSRGGE